MILKEARWNRCRWRNTKWWRSYGGGGAPSGGGEITAIKLSGAPGTPLTHCNPEMKVGMEEFYNLNRFSLFW